MRRGRVVLVSTRGVKRQEEEREEEEQEEGGEVVCHRRRGRERRRGVGSRDGGKGSGSV